jgi:hypothetical protein
LLTPNGGEQWRSGTSKKITWSTLLTDSVRLEYQVVPGDSWVLIATDIPAQNLSYAWLVPALESDSCRVRVSEIGNAGEFDVSDTTFTITQVVQTTEIEPNGSAFTAAKRAGNIFVLAAISMMAVMGLAALAIDVSLCVGQRAISCRRRDASALAGAAA